MSAWPKPLSTVRKQTISSQLKIDKIKLRHIFQLILRLIVCYSCLVIIIIIKCAHFVSVTYF